MSPKQSSIQFFLKSHQAMNYREELVEHGLWNANDPRDPSLDIAAAWELQERLDAAGWLMRLHRVDNGWSCDLHHRDTWVEIISGLQPTAALAIARAALQKEKLMTASELSLIKERNEQRRTLKARAKRGSYRSAEAKPSASEGLLISDTNSPTIDSARAKDDAAFMTHARNDDVEGDVDRLVAEVEQLQGLLAARGKDSD
jgi:hypothetical protein